MKSHSKHEQNELRNILGRRVYIQLYTLGTIIVQIWTFTLVYPGIPAPPSYDKRFKSNIPGIRPPRHRCALKVYNWV